MGLNPTWIEAAQKGRWLDAAKLGALDQSAPPGWVKLAALIAIADALLNNYEDQFVPDVHDDPSWGPESAARFT